jgi:hypothetical protein
MTDADDAPIEFTTMWYILALLLVLNSALSLGVNSIYVNNYMTRKNTPFKEILNESELTFMYVTFGIGLATCLCSILAFGYNYAQNQKIIRCDAEYDTEELVKDSNKLTDKKQKVKKRITQNMVTTKTNQNPPGCNELRLCKSASDYDENKNLSSESDKFCIPKTFSLYPLLICLIIVSLLSFSTASILWYDITQNQTKTHAKSTTSEGIYVYTLISAVISGAIPMVLFTYRYAQYNCARVSYVTKFKTQIREVPVKKEYTVAELLTMQISTPQAQK